MSTVFLQLQSTAANTNVNVNEVVGFNNLLSSSVNNIEFDSATNVITLPLTGVYYVYWSVVTAYSFNAPQFSLITSKGTTYSADTTMNEGILNGSAIIETQETGLKLRIVNTSGSSIRLADVSVVANLVIHSVEMDSFIGDPNVNINGGSVVNFSSGGIDVTNPLTYPILLDILQFSWISDAIRNLKDAATPAGIENILGLPMGILSNIAVSTVLSPIFATLQVAIDALFGPTQDMFEQTSDAGLLSMDSYIGHNNVGIVPAIATADLPILSLVAGPPYPQIIARDGIITSFAAEYDCIAAVDISLLNFLPGLINTVNGLITAVIDIFATLISALLSLGSILLSLGSPLPDDFADTLNKLLIAQFRNGIPATNHHVHAILWKGSPNTDNVLGGEMNWEKVSDLDLGAVQWLELAPVDAIISSIGDVVSAGSNILETTLSLLSGRGTANLSPRNTPFIDAKTSSIKHPISAGDYLMVQFTLVGHDNTTIIAGVLASSLMASVQIENL